MENTNTFYIQQSLPHQPRKPLTVDMEKAPHLFQEEKGQKTGDGT